jgi:hypothetical protein
VVTPLHNERRCCVHRLEKFWRFFNWQASRKYTHIKKCIISSLITKMTVCLFGAALLNYSITTQKQ